MLGLGLGIPFSRRVLSEVARIMALSNMGPLWDFSDKITMFQDSAGTQPVTAFGQPVGRVLDKSGKGNVLTQPTAINRPIYALDANGKPSLSFNGTNQWMQTSGNLDLSGTDKVTMVAGVRTLAWTSMVAELGSPSPGVPTLYLVSGADAGYSGWVALSRGNAVGTPLQATGINSTYPKSAVVTVTHDIAASLSTIRENKVAGTPGTADKGTGNFIGTAPLFVGARSGSNLFFTGNMHTLCIRAALSTQLEIDLLERFANSRTGAWA